MPKPMKIAIPHDLGGPEVRRRLDLHTEWALKKLEKDGIDVAISDWSKNERAFTAHALGQTVQGRLVVAEQSLTMEAAVPWAIGIFSPVIEAAAKHYSARLLAPVAPA